MNASANEYQERLSRIATQWTLLVDAHRNSGTDPQSIRADLAQRYVAAVYRYLLAMVRDPDVADDLCQEFVVKFLKGEFHQACPERGRFRDYIKTVVINLVRTHHRRQGKSPRPLPDQELAADEPPQDHDEDATFVREWKAELLDQTWQSLLRERPNYYHVLRLRVSEPELTAREIAGRLEVEQSQAPLKPDNVRKILERAHTKFAALLVNEVAESLSSPDPDAVRQELTALDLLKYCRSALEDWARKLRRRL